jgi:26S proteasome regulatory subunit N5
VTSPHPRLHQIFDTPKVKEDPQALQDNLKTAVSFLLLSKYDNQRQDMLHRVKALKELQALSSFSAILTLFTTNEVIPFPFPHQEEVEAAIRSSQKSPDDEKATEFCALLRTRVTEHNIRVLHSYYTRIHSSRMATMLGLTVDELEEQLSEMSSSGEIFVKIDRPQGIISFAAPSAPEEVLSDWAGEIGSMLSLMESTCHLINRENMVHKIA